ncbi:10510_t:CDS:2 [Diversispora eburnea]|uniref:10510_t:CDS:1 n=1 Tax=Diversispora eburnea TaxID=1213867 RepID=A0A9N9CRI0_9GLOM|nr:10510_t:CDS:2 [Diversispora eburnea]
MSQKIENINHCPAGHSFEDFVYSYYKNLIKSDGKCSLCTKEHFIQEFKTWSTDGRHASVYSAKLENGIKVDWNFIKQGWEYRLIGRKVALKEIKDSRYDIAEFLKVVWWKSKIQILSLIASGLESLHEKNFVHCDLRSGNILIDYFDLELEIDLSLRNFEII